MPYSAFELIVKNMICENKAMLLVYQINTLGQVYEAVKNELGLRRKQVMFYNTKTKEATYDMGKTISEFGLNEDIKLEIIERSCEEACFFKCKHIIDDLKYLNIYKEDENVFDEAIEIKVVCDDNGKNINTYVMPNTPLRAISDGLFNVLHLLRGYDIVYEQGVVKTENSSITAKEFGLHTGSELKITQKDYWMYMYFGGKDSC